MSLSFKISMFRNTKMVRNFTSFWGDNSKCNLELKKKKSGNWYILIFLNFHNISLPNNYLEKRKKKRMKKEEEGFHASESISYQFTSEQIHFFLIKNYYLWWIEHRLGENKKKHNYYIFYPLRKQVLIYFFLI